MPDYHNFPNLTKAQLNEDRRKPYNWRDRWYYGIRSRPMCVATSESRVGWKRLSSLDCGFPSRKYILIPSRDHPLHAIWSSDIAPKIRDILDKLTTGQICLDVVRICDQEEEIETAVMVIWIGVLPDSLSEEEGIEVVEECKGVLDERGLEDVNIGIRETHVCLLGLDLMDPNTLDYLMYTKHQQLIRPFTNTLGLPLSTSRLGEIGTSGVCLRNPDTNQHYLLTAKHVVSQEDPSQTSPTIYLFDDASFEEHTKELDEKISYLERVLDGWLKRNETSVIGDADTHELAGVSALREEVRDSYGRLEQRVIGRVVASSSNQVKNQAVVDYPHDWALIELDNGKHDQWSSHNRIDPRGESEERLANSHRDVLPTWTTDYYHFDTLDITTFRDRSSIEAGGLAVLKHGAKTGLTMGENSAYLSYCRTQHRQGSEYSWSQHIPIISFLKDDCLSRESTNFAGVGDSGSAVVTRDGTLCGMITLGSGMYHGYDLVYFTPIDYILDDIRKTVKLDLVLA
jgi:uncharacterized protein YozE (UPF0346 family)